MKSYATSRVAPRSLTRRSILAGLGVSAATLPFLPVLESAAGGGETPPLRFLVFYHPHGVVRDAWLPTGTTDDFTLPTILAPLSAFQDRLLVLDGLDVRPTGPIGGHHTVGPPFVFTGSPMEEGTDFDHGCCTPHGWNTHASIDQVIADAIGPGTPFGSLQVGVQTGGNHPGGRISYAGPGQPLAPERNPQALFEAVFGELGVDEATAAKRRADRLSVIDLVAPELEAVQGKVGANDQLKIERHLDALRDMETQLQTEYTCTTPAAPAVAAYDDVANVGTVSRQQLDILAEALACDLTRVASVMYRQGENDGKAYPHLGVDAEHHFTSHEVLETNTAARDDLVTIYEFYGQELAYLAGRLDGMVESDGTTVLDNTIVLWTSEVAVGRTHVWDSMPIALLGGGGGRIQTGRFHQYGGENHCRLLVTLCQAYGLDVDTFGGFDTGGGALPGILA
jgi:hypothetical protein